MKILVTGSTDGIGLETVKLLAKENHELLIHGRNSKKIEIAVNKLKEVNSDIKIDTYCYDLSSLNEVKNFANDVLSKHDNLDVLINNAGVFNVLNKTTVDDLDTRFSVNTISPYLLTKLLSLIMGKNSRVITLSSAAQAPFDVNSISKPSNLNANTLYAQSKLAITMWTFELAKNDSTRNYIAVNPGSLLASKMVKEAYGIAGSSLLIGANILCKAALREEFKNASGKYFDNDSRQFRDAYIDAYDSGLRKQLIQVLDEIIKDYIK